MRRSPGQNYPALVAMPKAALVSKGEVIEVAICPARSQGGLPVCYGITAWYAFMQFQCKQSGADCKSLSVDQIFIHHDWCVVDKELHEKYGRTYNKVAVLHRWWCLESLSNLSGEDELWAESPAERIFQKFGGNNRKMYNAFEALRTQFFDKNKSEGKICMTCLLDTLRNDFDLKSDQASAQQALNENVFDKFLFDLFVKGCKKKVSIGEFSLGGWPNMSETRSYEGFINRLTDLLKRNTPVLVDICLDQKNVSGIQCKSGHAVVIAGYRKVCNGSKCTDYLKVINSWGESWQKQNSDGWVDGRNLYEYMEVDSGMGWIK
jgi:hypothetical protein